MRRRWMEAPALMEAQTVPTSARYIDKLTTVGTCSTSRENEATRTLACSLPWSFSLSSSVPENNPYNVTCGLGCTTTHQTGTSWTPGNWILFWAWYNSHFGPRQKWQHTYEGKSFFVSFMPAWISIQTGLFWLMLDWCWYLWKLVSFE